MIEKILSDALFAAIAAIGFSAISNPPREAYMICALIAAIGHSSRFILMNAGFAGLDIIQATGIASLIVGSLALLFSQMVRIPAETFLFPSLLPMIPGIYAYRTFGALAMYLFSHAGEADSMHYLYLLSGNGLTCTFIILGMVVGGMLPIFVFRAGRYRKYR